MKFKNRKTGEIVTGSMIFINNYSDWGAASIETTLINIRKDYEQISEKDIIIESLKYLELYITKLGKKEITQDQFFEHIFPYAVEEAINYIK